MDTTGFREPLDRLALQLRVVRRYLLEEESQERVMDARAILSAMGEGIGQLIDRQIDPRLGWRPGRAVNILPAARQR